MDASNVTDSSYKISMKIINSQSIKIPRFNLKIQYLGSELFCFQIYQHKEYTYKLEIKNININSLNLLF